MNILAYRMQAGRQKGDIPKKSDQSFQQTLLLRHKITTNTVTVCRYAVYLCMRVYFFKLKNDNRGDG